MIRCPYCAKYVNEDDEFCRFCGQALKKKDLICPICGESLNSMMHTCPGCGQDLKKILRVNEHIRYQSKVRKKIVILSLIFIMLAVGISSYVFFRQRELNNYNLQMSYYIQSLNNTNKILAAMFTKNKIITPKECKNQLQIQEKNIDEINKKNSSVIVPHEYDKLAKSMKQLLGAENNLIHQLIIITDNPMTGVIDDKAKDIQKNINEIKQLAANITVAGQKVIVNDSFMAIKDNVMQWIKKLREDYAKNNKQFSAMEKFLTIMDQNVQQYDIIKERLPDILSNLRKGGYTWAEYFSELDKAKNKRMELEKAVDAIHTESQAGAALRQSFHNVLSVSLQYVNAAKQAARIEFEDNDYNAAKPYYDKAEVIHQREEDAYRTFIKQYEDAKKQQEQLQIIIKQQSL